MRPKSSSAKKPAEQVVKDIRRATRRHFSAEDKIRIVLDGLRGDDSSAELCRKEGIAQSLDRRRQHRTRLNRSEIVKGRNFGIRSEARYCEPDFLLPVVEDGSGKGVQAIPEDRYSGRAATRSGHTQTLQS